MRRREARAVAELAADLQQRLGRLGVPSGTVPDGDAASIVAQLAPWVAAADHAAEKAARRQAVARGFAGRSLDRMAAGMAEARTPVDVSALAEWSAFQLDPVAAFGSLS
jgi:hypothetical protein